MKSAFVLRADGGAAMGLGHLYRCLTLAEFLKVRGHDVGLATIQCPDPIAARFEHAGVVIRRLPSSSSEAELHRMIRDFAAVLGASAVVTDLWPVTAEDIGNLRRDLGPFRLACMDSGCLQGAVADAVIRPGVRASGNNGFGSPSAMERFYQGIEYFPLKHSLAARRNGQRKEPSHAGRIVVTMGGGDARGATFKVLECLQPFHKEIHAEVIAGPAFPFLDQLHRMSALEEWITVHDAPDEPSEFFERADLCITAGGFTLYELAFLGIPALALATEDHQLDTIAAFEVKGSVLSAGHLADLDTKKFGELFLSLSRSPERRAEMSAAGRRLIDGQGAERIAQILESL